MRLPRDRRLEFFNEANIMCCIYHFYCFTDFVDVPTRVYVGYSLIGCVSFNLLVNMLVMFKVAGSDLIHKLRKARYKFRFWRAKRNRLANHKRKSAMTDEDFLTEQRLKMA
jgi:hypothetical protein